MDKTPLLMPLTPAHLELPDDELGKLFLGLYVFAEAEKRGIRPDEVSEEFTRHVISLVPQIEATGARLTTIEKVLHKAAAGEFVTAGRLLREHMLDGAFNMAARDEAVTRRRWRQSIASKGRGDALSRLIYEIVKGRDGALTESELMKQLEKYQGSGVIEEITDDEIWFVRADGTGHPAPISGLRGRLSRAKKKFKESLSR